jgi:carboxylate-amine ligase
MASLAALTHCLARRAAEDEPGADPPAEVLEEGIFRAARFGVEARLPDAEGYLHPVSELLEQALELARGPAAELDCERELERLPMLLARGGGAGRQRAAYAIAGMDYLLREMTHITSAEAASAEDLSPSEGATDALSI